MSDPTIEGLLRENLYLKSRVLRLTQDVTDISAEADRLRQTLDRLHGRHAAHRPDPLGGGGGQ